MTGEIHQLVRILDRTGVNFDIDEVGLELDSREGTVEVCTSEVCFKGATCANSIGIQLAFSDSLRVAYDPRDCLGIARGKDIQEYDECLQLDNDSIEKDIIGHWLNNGCPAIVLWWRRR